MNINGAPIRYVTWYSTRWQSFSDHHQHTAIFVLPLFMKTRELRECLRTEGHLGIACFLKNNYVERVRGVEKQYFLPAHRKISDVERKDDQGGIERG